MVFKLVSAALFLAAIGPIVAAAQTVAQIGQPAERPAASYKGAQYVDSRGCVFMNASYAGAAQWVARVNRSHKVLCGYPPTFGPKPVIDAAEDVVPRAPVMVTPARANAPMATVASAMMPEAVTATPVPKVRVKHSVAGVVAHMPVPSQSYQRVAVAGAAAGKIGCYTNAPVAEVVRLRNGGSAVVCTRGDGTLNGWRPPIYPASAGVGAALRDPAQVVRLAGNGAGRVAAARVYATARVPDVVVPKGYKLAWTDDRLNPMRGIGTPEGQAAQDRLWTKEVPARLIADATKTKRPKAAAGVTVSSMGDIPKVGATWVQIGTFGVASNATGAAQQLAALGLQVAKSKLHRGGRDLQIVLAGPFASTADAKAALQAARGAGFGDAYIR